MAAKRFNGRLTGIDDNQIISIDTASGPVSLSFDAIESAKLDPSEWFLKPSKAGRKGNPMDTSTVPGAELIQVADIVARENQSTVKKSLSPWNRPSKKPAARVVVKIVTSLPILIAAVVPYP